ncbi:MAG: bifunctional phosphopantothenoylcysteine decarboxylase/phosphopantothenate--cysteine ligase CoaBC [Flavobacteriales bacterium]|jgi:phosphopantothenoylcysteine decarboxylase / phosphopantothenate---cysteine ligase|nr:bifunctional phosphopantothenoylcysteine decarboxylase/phosphopantothenate--cysteine ligase CoaBC [Flavobacteriales bacterium]
MSVLSGKKILLGVTAGIAAYKIPFLIRLLIKAGAEVQVVITPAAKDFVTPLTLSTLSKKPVYASFFNEEDKDATWNSHVDLALWADYMLFAPLTANTLAKMAQGVTDNLLMAVYLSAKCPVYFAPAMDLDMYKHPTTAKNIEILQSYGHRFIPPESGELASGLVGEGRMAEPESVVQFLEQSIVKTLPLFGQKVLITAGPTYEAIDPVRFIGNHSSGKMGVALANTAVNLGASVTLVMGPSALKTNNSQINQIDVVSAEDMFEATTSHFDTANIAILAAAVADYKPAQQVNQKIKKKDSSLHIDLVLTKDILATLGANKKHQFLVGFALETNDEVENAKEKLKRKNLDLIILNSLNDKGAGFKKDTNKITIIDADTNIKSFPLKDKELVAKDIFTEILNKINA